jgi:predicted Ser/Thr protein kinase
MSQSDSQRLAELIDSVADGTSIDWDAADAAAMNDEERRLLRMLRVVAGIAEVHRSDAPTAEAKPPAAPLPKHPALTPTADGALGHWGHFQLLRKLGEGAFGEVYHARDTWLDHSVAVKLLKAPLVDRARFLHEARTLARIRHANVVAIHGADEHDGRLGFWMEFIDGHTLAQVVDREGVRSAGEAALIGQHLCQAIAAVHAGNILHRDIKAQNVIRQSGTGRIVLMDFGAGEAMDAERAGHRPRGTPLYLAPELFDGSAATKETDIYALGVLLFNLVTSSYPVYGGTVDELVRAHRRNARHHLGDMRPDLPDDFVRVVETMLAVDPAGRYHSATEARKALEQVVAPRDAVPAPPPPQAASWLRRAYAAGVAVAAAVLALVVIGFVSTGVFDITFGRGAFDNSTPLDWFSVGRMVALAPVLRLAILAIPLIVIITAARVFCRIVPPLGRTASRFGGACHEFLRRRELHDPSLILSAIAGIGALVFGALALYHWSDATIFTIFASNAAPEGLAALQPANEPQYDIFQRRFEYLLFLYGVVVCGVYISVRRTGVRVPAFVAAYVIAVPAIAFLFMRAMPWMVVYGNELPRVDYAATRCYELGRRADETLVFCPDDEPPRVQRHKNSELRDRGFRENIFTPSSQARVFAPPSP